MRVDFLLAVGVVLIVELKFLVGEVLCMVVGVLVCALVDMVVGVVVGMAMGMVMGVVVGVVVVLQVVEVLKLLAVDHTWRWRVGCRVCFVYSWCFFVCGGIVFFYIMVAELVGACVW